MRKKRIIKIDAVKPQVKKTRVAAYCRVSTLMEDQRTSLANQKAHYTDLIRKHKNWTFAGLYYDDGISGTKKETRPELNRMMDDCKEGRIDLILTKSISRFARNTTDCLEMVRSLTHMGVNIIFEKENVDTRRMESEFILTILSSLAEEESHSTSENENWRIQKDFENGTFRIKQAPYGYRWVDGDFLIDPVDSEVLKWMFDRILEGKGSYWIARKLNEAGIPPRRNGTWSAAVIRRIVQNPACMGDVLLKKTYKDKNFHVIRNLGEKPMYYVDHHHEGIIDRETFQLAQDAIRQRGKEKGTVLEDPQTRMRHQSKRNTRYPMSGKLTCGECGGSMVRVTQYTAQGPRFHWVCSNHREKGNPCRMKQVLEENIQNAFVTMLNKLCYAPYLLDWYCENTAGQRSKEKETRLQEIREELQENTRKRHRLALLLSSGCCEPGSFQKELVELQEETSRLKDERYHLSKPVEDTASSFRHFVNGWENGSAFPEDAFTEYVERVIVHSQTSFTFELRFGLKLTEGEK